MTLSRRTYIDLAVIHTPTHFRTSVACQPSQRCTDLNKWQSKGITTLGVAEFLLRSASVYPGQVLRELAKKCHLQSIRAATFKPLKPKPTIEI